MVMRGRNQFAWALAACAAVVAQVATTPLCQACDRPCRAGLAGGHTSNTPDSIVEPTDGCSQCVGEAGYRRAETTERPCHCQRNARDDQPLSPSRGTPTGVADDAPSSGLAVVPPVVPLNLGVSREYLAALLAVPIRPPRILFGVWRN